MGERAASFDPEQPPRELERERRRERLARERSGSEGTEGHGRKVIPLKREQQPKERTLEDDRRELAILEQRLHIGDLQEGTPEYDRYFALKAALKIIERQQPEPLPAETRAENRTELPPEPQRQGQPLQEYLRGLSLEDLQSELRRTRGHADLGHEDAQAALADFYAELDRRRKEQRRPPKQARPTSRIAQKPPAAPTMTDKELNDALGEAVGPSSLLTDESDPYMKGRAAVGAEGGSDDLGTTETPPDTTEAPTIPTPAPSESAAPIAEETASEAAVEDVPKPQPEELKPEESGTDKHDEVPPTERPMRQWKAGVVEIEEKVEDIARHRAEERLQAELRGERPEGGKRPGWLQRLVQKTSRHWGEEGYRYKYIAEERKRILSQIEGLAPNMFAPDEKTSEAHRIETEAIVERFLADFEGAVRTNEGERKETLAEGATKDAIRGLMVDYVNGDTDEQVFVERKGQLLKGLGAENQALFEKEGATVDNFLDVAREIRATMQHGERIAAQDVNVDVNLGKYRSAIKEQANLRAFDKLVKVIQKNPVLSKVVNPAVLGFTVSLASKPLISGIRGLAKYSGLGALGAGTVVGAGFAALRRSTEVKGDITHTRRGTTSGYEIPKGAKRLEKMQEFAYDQANVKELTGSIEQQIAELQNDQLSDTERQQHLQALMAEVANAEARQDAGTTLKHDFLRYEDATEIERGRMNFLKSLAEAKVGMRKFLEANAGKAGVPADLGQSLNELKTAKKQNCAGTLRMLTVASRSSRTSKSQKPRPTER